jgi:hypothetical protein
MGINLTDYALADAVAVRVMGYTLEPTELGGIWRTPDGGYITPQGDSNGWNPHDEMNDAWTVYLEVVGRRSSIRNAFYDALKRMAYEKTGRRVKWPDVFAVLGKEFPRYCCLAALEALGYQHKEG